MSGTLISIFEGFFIFYYFNLILLKHFINLLSRDNGILQLNSSKLPHYIFSFAYRVVHLIQVSRFILQAKKFLKCDWLRQVVFKPNLKYLHVKITPVSMVTEK